MNRDKRNVILVGGGGHALSLMEFAEPKIKGYLSLSPSHSMPVNWLGNDEQAPVLIREGYEFHVAFVYSGLPLMFGRKKIIDTYERNGASFATLISADATVTRSSEIREGSAIMTGSIINRAFLSKNVIVNSGAIVEHDCRIGNNTFIGPGAIIGGFVSIGDDCFIGLGAKIKNGVTIASGVTVGMGLIIDRDLNEPGIYHGQPLKHLNIDRWRNL